MRGLPNNLLQPTASQLVVYLSWQHKVEIAIYAKLFIGSKAALLHNSSLPKIAYQHDITDLAAARQRQLFAVRREVEPEDALRFEIG